MTIILFIDDERVKGEIESTIIVIVLLKNNIIIRVYIWYGGGSSTTAEQTVDRNTTSRSLVPKPLNQNFETSGFTIYVLYIDITVEKI